MPEGFDPMLAKAGPLPSGEGWAHEFKWDGVRAGVAVESGRVRIRSRNGSDLTRAFPDLHPLGSAFDDTAVLFDGELVVFSPTGRPDFGLIQRRLQVNDSRKAARLAETLPTNLVVFDLLYLDGELLVDRAYQERRRRLQVLGANGPSWAVAPSFEGVPAEDVMAAARSAGLEGVVSKRVDSPYRWGSRTDDWVKTKLERTQEVLIGGFTRGKGSRHDTFGALLLGVPDDQGLVYAGRVGTGFSDADRHHLLDLLRPLISKTSPFTNPPMLSRSLRSVTWTRASVVGEVRFTERTNDGLFRHPTWRGVRVDKSPSEVVGE